MPGLYIRKRTLILTLLKKKQQQQTNKKKKNKQKKKQQKKQQHETGLVQHQKTLGTTDSFVRVIQRLVLT